MLLCRFFHFYIFNKNAASFVLNVNFLSSFFNLTSVRFLKPSSEAPGTSLLTGAFSREPPPGAELRSSGRRNP